MGGFSGWSLLGVPSAPLCLVLASLCGPGSSGCRLGLPRAWPASSLRGWCTHVSWAPVLRVASAPVSAGLGAAGALGVKPGEPGTGGQTSKGSCTASLEKQLFACSACEQAPLLAPQTGPQSVLAVPSGSGWEGHPARAPGPAASVLALALPVTHLWRVGGREGPVHSVEASRALSWRSVHPERRQEGWPRVLPVPSVLCPLRRPRWGI